MNLAFLSSISTDRLRRMEDELHRCVFDATLSAIVWFLSYVYSSRAYSGSFIAVWNGTIRLISFLIVAYGTSKIRSLRALNCETSHDHPSQSKTLADGFLSVQAARR